MSDLSAPKTPMLDLILIISLARKRIALTTAAALFLGVLMAFLIPPNYTAVATIMSPQSPQSSLSSLMGQLGSLSTLGGGAGLLKNPADLYVGILQSRTITDQVIDKFHLMSQWKVMKRDDARKRVGSLVQFEVAKNGLIEITAKDKNPQRASDLANFYVDALYAMNSHLAITEASQRRVFFDQQLSEEKAALVRAEEELKATQQKTGLISLGGQADLAVRNIAQARATISSKEVELQGLRTYAADENPDIIRVQREIGTLRGQLSQLENSQNQLSPGDTGIPANQVPAGSLEYARKLREVRYHDTLLELLSRQYEAARIDEAKSAPIIQVVDRAVPPDRRSGPSRLLLVVGAGFIGLCAACAWAFWSSVLEGVRQNPGLAGKLDEIYRGRRL